MSAVVGMRVLYYTRQKNREFTKSQDLDETQEGGTERRLSLTSVLDGI